MFSDVVSAICDVATVQRKSFPSAEKFVVTSCATILDSVNPQTDDSVVDSTDISTVNWAKEDPTLGRVIGLLKDGCKPQNIVRKSETAEVSKYFRVWSKLYLSYDVLYRSTVLDGVETNQLVL